MRPALLLVTAAVVAVALACGRSGLEPPFEERFDVGPRSPPPHFTGSLCSGASLVLSFDFEGNAVDASPNALLTSTYLVSYVPGPEGLAIALESSSALIVPDTDTIDGKKLTLDFWIDPLVLPTAGSRSGVIDKNGQFGVFLYPGGWLRCGISGGVAATIATNAWTHVACARAQSSLTLYVDGAMVSTSAASGVMGTGGAIFRIGEDSPDGDDQLLGAIDSFRMCAE